MDLSWPPRKGFICMSWSDWNPSSCITVPQKGVKTASPSGVLSLVPLVLTEERWAWFMGNLENGAFWSWRKIAWLCCYWENLALFFAPLIDFCWLLSEDFQPGAVWGCSWREGSEGNCLQGHGSTQEQELWFLWNSWKVHRKGPGDKIDSATERGKKRQPESCFPLSTLSSVWSRRNSKASKWLLWHYLHNLTMAPRFSCERQYAPSS